MKVFDSFPPINAKKERRERRSAEREVTSPNDSRMIKHEKPAISESAVRKKLAEKNSEIATEAQSSKTVTKKAPDQFDFPLDTEKDNFTHDKLKKMITDGGFNFSDKEREVLKTILKD